MLKFNCKSCFFFIAAALLLASCQRDVDGSLPAIKVSSKNPATLSASLKVWHGVRTTGTAPAPTGNTPAIDPALNPTVKAFAGRYAIIKPEVTSGVVAGYYIGVPGSGQYFKLDFSKPRDIAGRNIRPNRNGILHRTTSGTADSSIVIVLPPNINVPDTFCVTYCPYDAAGNIGQPVTTCIIVTSLGAGTNNGWLQNDFKLTSSWDVSGGVRVDVDTVIYNKWIAEGDGYYCDATSNPPFLSGGALALGYVPLISDSVYYRKNNLRFAINGAFDYKENADDKYIDHVLSTCTQFFFRPVENYKDSLTGAYSYNSTTNKLVFIWEFDAQGIPDPDYWEYDVIKINDNHFILRDPIDNYFIRFQR
jgi:hypothetical protein